MEYSPAKLEVKVGIFVASGILAMIVAIILLGGDKSLFTKYTHLKVHFSEVQGLFPGSVVSLAGVPVGNVEKIDFGAADSKLEVTLKINNHFATRLVQGTSAEIRTQGALGDKYIYLVPGESGSQILTENSVIPSTETDFMKMLTSREDGVARVVDLIKELHIFVASINAGGKTSEVMVNIAEASGKLKKTLGQIDGLVTDLRGEIPGNKKLQQSLLTLSSILDKIDQGKGTLGQLINDPSVHQNLKAFLGGSQRNRYMKDIIRETIQQNEAGK
jgi:phospholipid/cholesterol/gamma-HCH transport system substrate-binding protein